MTDKQYPECEKWAKLLDGGGRQILQFLEWLDEQGIYLDLDQQPHMTSEQLLYKYGDVNPRKLEEERQDMISSLNN